MARKAGTGPKLAVEDLRAQLLGDGGGEVGALDGLDVQAGSGSS